MRDNKDGEQCPPHLVHCGWHKPSFGKDGQMKNPKQNKQHHFWSSLYPISLL